MYPNALSFVPLERTDHAVAVGWRVESQATVTGFLLFRATRPIAADEMEALYEGRLSDVVTTVTLPRTAHTLIDDEWVTTAWYAAVAMETDGNLVEIPVRPVEVANNQPTAGTLRMSTVRAVGPRPMARCGHQGLSDNVYSDPPAMVYRTDTPQDALRLKAIESALTRRFDDPSSD